MREEISWQISYLVLTIQQMFVSYLRIRSESEPFISMCMEVQQ